VRAKAISSSPAWKPGAIQGLAVDLGGTPDPRSTRSVGCGRADRAERTEIPSCWRVPPEDPFTRGRSQAWSAPSSAGAHSPKTASRLRALPAEARRVLEASGRSARRASTASFPLTVGRKEYVAAAQRARSSRSTRKRVFVRRLQRPDRNTAASRRHRIAATVTDPRLLHGPARRSCLAPGRPRGSHAPNSARARVADRLATAPRRGCRRDDCVASPRCAPWRTRPWTCSCSRTSIPRWEEAKDLSSVDHWLAWATSTVNDASGARSRPRLDVASRR